MFFRLFYGENDGSRKSCESAPDCWTPIYTRPNVSHPNMFIFARFSIVFSRRLRVFAGAYVFQIDEVKTNFLSEISISEFSHLPRPNSDIQTPVRLT